MLKLTFHGHSCWEFDDGTHRVLIDPFLTGNPLADVGPESFPKLDAILDLARPRRSHRRRRRDREAHEGARRRQLRDRRAGSESTG